MLSAMRGLLRSPVALEASATLSRFRSQRWLCGVTDEQKAEVESFLKNAQRPKMGKAKAKQSAGQKAIDLMKQASRVNEGTLDDLLRMDSKQLKEKGVQQTPNAA